MLLAAAIAATAAYAYANSINGVNPPLLGSGTATIEKNKYSIPGGIGAVTFNLNANDPRNVDSISFPLTGATAATHVWAQLAGAWYSCISTAAPTTVACTTTGASASVAWTNGTGQLNVVAWG